MSRVSKWIKCRLSVFLHVCMFLHTCTHVCKDRFWDVSYWTRITDCWSVRSQESSSPPSQCWGCWHMLPFASFYVAPGNPNSYPCALLTETSGLQFEGQGKITRKWFVSGMFVCAHTRMCACMCVYWGKSLGTKAQSGHSSQAGFSVIMVHSVGSYRGKPRLDCGGLWPLE